MYSRNRAVRPEARYAENVPYVYGGSRFYRQEPADVPAEIRAEDVRAAGAEGIPVQYEIPAGASARSAEECSIPPAEEAMPQESGGEQPKKTDGVLASVFSDPEDLLLLGLLLLFCLESERCADVIVILLLLLIVH